MSSTMLKMIALFFMLLDHIGTFIPNMPIYLHWIGRLSAPIFIFCSGWGFTYTSNKRAYLTRLYIAGIGMAIIQCFTYVDNNFFRTLFSLCIIIFLVDSYRNKDKNFKRYISIYLIWQISTIVICILLLNIQWLSEEFIACFLGALFGNIFNLEGGMVFVCLGVLMYLTKNNKKLFAIGYTGFCFMYYIITKSYFLPCFLGKLFCWGFDLLSDVIEYMLDTIIGLSPMNVGGSMLFENYQWMMILALPFMLYYNNKRGKKIKYFFYIFYPVHILILFYLGNMI